MIIYENLLLCPKSARHCSAGSERGLDVIGGRADLLGYALVKAEDFYAFRIRDGGRQKKMQADAGGRNQIGAGAQLTFERFNTAWSRGYGECCRRRSDVRPTPQQIV